jgi:7,8-dihydro-6-hydroxymethylpterin dimethyltransferase
VLSSVDTRLSRESGRIDVLMLSGGEPTLYPYLSDVLAELAQRNVIRVLVNTNGVRIARDDGLLDLLAGHRERVEVYLQFVGRRRRPGTTGAETCARSKIGRSSGCPGGASSPRSP